MSEIKGIYAASLSILHDNLALNISGQAEWEHEPVLEYLATEEWSNTGMFPTGEMA